jgi:hypothetical protein
VLPDSDEFLALLGDPDPDYDAAAFAVRNLAFIKLHILPQSIMEIEVHPRNVGFRAIQAVQEQLLLTSQIKLFVIKYLDRRWQSEISPSVEHTIRRLSELCADPERNAVCARARNRVCRSGGILPCRGQVGR